MTTIRLLDARWQFVPTEGWLFIVVWERSDGRGHLVEEVHRWPT